MSTEFNIGFDYSHNNKLNIQDPFFNDFREYLLNSGLKLGKIEGSINYEKLLVYDIFIIGVPSAGSYLKVEEINDIIKYVYDGGSLLIISDKGGDVENKNNLNELSHNFGIKFNSDQLFDNENFSKDNSKPIINQFKKHFITHEISQIIYYGGCTLEIDKNVDIDDIDVNTIAFSSENSAWHRYNDGDEWINEPVNKIAIIAVVHYGLGKVVAIGNLSLFSNFHDLYGIQATDNFKLVCNIISWLSNKAHSEEAQLSHPIYTTIPIEQDLFYWIKEKLDEGRWNSIQEAINFALKVVKIRMQEQDKNLD